MKACCDAILPNRAAVSLLKIPFLLFQWQYLEGAISDAGTATCKGIAPRICRLMRQQEYSDSSDGCWSNAGRKSVCMGCVPDGGDGFKIK